MSKHSLWSSVLAMAVTLILFNAGAGWWSLLVYAVDCFSYACGIAKGCQR